MGVRRDDVRMKSKVADEKKRVEVENRRHAEGGGRRIKEMIFRGKMRAPAEERKRKCVIGGEEEEKKDKVLMQIYLKIIKCCNYSSASRCLSFIIDHKHERKNIKNPP